MPELPEIETIRRSFSPIINSKIAGVNIIREDILKLKDFTANDILGKLIVDIRRRGKFLDIVIEQDKHLILHLGMSGKCYMVDETILINEPHVHFILNLDNNIKIVYQDPRRFGGVWFVGDYNKFFSHMGLEPLSDDFTSEYLTNLIKNRKVAIKNLILNQRLIAGIGNIYADEALFLAGIKPNRPAHTLSKKEVTKLREAIREILKYSIEQRGTTFRDFRDGYNQIGNFQNYLKVYGKKNQSCPNCGDILTLEKIGGRSSHYCPSCQK